MRRVQGVALAGCLATLFGCSSTAPLPSTVPNSSVMPVSSSSRSGFEQDHRERASNAARQGKLADAALSWEVLTVLRPDVAEYREALADTRRQIDAAVADRLPRAAQAQRRGDLDGATQLYLSVLALQPDQTVAADALRGIERERVKRQQLGRSSRLTLTRRAATEAEVMADKAAVAGGADRNELEHVAMLARQGELDTAIGLLDRRVAGNRNDRAARELLADLYERKAEEALVARDSAGAIALLEKSLRLDPADTRVAERLKKLRASVPRPTDAKVR
ncbi:MAG: hypothetical protein Q7T97_06925 [Burkholderiaceae bacterium]|nr:hypothetical protein [Burkholderiaceae bacterium]